MGKRLKNINFIPIVGVLFLLIVFSILQIGGCNENNKKGFLFPQPEERTSQNGILRTNIEVALATGAFPHDPFTTNIHTHGLTVIPGGISDNVFRKMEPGGTVNPVEIEIPSDHQTGTFWYHPHKHGSVSFQFFGGMSGFLIIEGGPGTLDTVPEVKAAKEVLMAFQVIRTDQDGEVPYVNTDGDQFSSVPGISGIGLWSTFQDSFFYLTTNGVTSPILHMRPGEVQRWRLLNAASGVTLPVALQNHKLNIVSNDGITVSEMVTLDEGEPYVMGAGNRVDVMIKAGEPGVYLLQVLDIKIPYKLK